MNKNEVASFLIEKAHKFNQLEFIENDPISIPHRFHKKEDIEISGLLTAIISWGRRDLIIRSATNLLDRMDYSPYDYVVHASESELRALDGFVYRTFQSSDSLDLVRCLRRIYSDLDGIESLFMPKEHEEDSIGGIMRFRKAMLTEDHQKRFKKHIADPSKGSAAKRLHMFLRWMARKDEAGVDFGIWEDFPMSKLMIPLDVHSGRVARSYGLLERKMNDHKAVCELTEIAKRIVPEDPCILDYALFGIGVTNALET